MRSWIGRVVFGLGGFLVVAGLLGLVWAPGVVEKTPVDVKTITYLDGEAGKLDASTGELVRNPIFAISDTKTDSEVSTDDVVAWVSTSCVMIDRGGERSCVDGSADMITASVDVFATDRVSGEAVNEGIDLPADATPHEGLVNKWPFNAEQKTYPYWDGTLGRAVDAVYDRTEEIGGIEAYVYEVSVVEAPAEIAAGTQGTYSTSKEIFVEPKTGSIVNQTEDQQRWLEDGTPALDLQLAFTEDQVASSVADAKDNKSLLTVIEVVLPIVGFVGGGLLLVIGFLMMRRPAGEAEAVGGQDRHPVAQRAVVLDVGHRAAGLVDLDVGPAVPVGLGRDQTLVPGVVGEHPPRGVGDGEGEPAAGPEHPRDLRDRVVEVGDELQRPEGGEDRVEAGVAEGQRGRGAAHRRDGQPGHLVQPSRVLQLAVGEVQADAAPTLGAHPPGALPGTGTDLQHVLVAYDAEDPGLGLGEPLGTPHEAGVAEELAVGGLVVVGVAVPVRPVGRA